MTKNDRECRCPNCRVADADAPHCTKHPRCLAREGQEGACTSLRHVPMMLAKVIAASVKRKLA